MTVFHLYFMMNKDSKYIYGLFFLVLKKMVLLLYIDDCLIFSPSENKIE